MKLNLFIILQFNFISRRDIIQEIISFLRSLDLSSSSNRKRCDIFLQSQDRGGVAWLVPIARFYVSKATFDAPGQFPKIEIFGTLWGLYAPRNGAPGSPK